MAAIKDYLHLRVVEAHHLPVLFSSIAFSCFCFSSIFHPEGITRIGNSFKFLNKFLNCQSQTIFWKLYVLLSKNLYLLNGCKEISKFANVVWFFGLIFQAGCWRVVVSFFISERHFGILKILYCHCRTWRHIFPSPFYIVLLSTTDRGCIFNNRLSTRLGSIEHAWHLGYKRLLSLIYHLILSTAGTLLIHRNRFQSHFAQRLCFKEPVECIGGSQ